MRLKLGNVFQKIFLVVFIFQSSNVSYATPPSATECEQMRQLAREVKELLEGRNCFSQVEPLNPSEPLNYRANRPGAGRPMTPRERADRVRELTGPILGNVRRADLANAIPRFVDARSVINWVLSPTLLAAIGAGAAVTQGSMDLSTAYAAVGAAVGGMLTVLSLAAYFSSNPQTLTGAAACFVTELFPMSSSGPEAMPRNQREFLRQLRNLEALATQMEQEMNPSAWQRVQSFARRQAEAIRSRRAARANQRALADRTRIRLEVGGDEFDDNCDRRREAALNALTQTSPEQARAAAGVVKTRMLALLEEAPSTAAQSLINPAGGNNPRVGISAAACIAPPERATPSSFEPVHQLYSSIAPAAQSAAQTLPPRSVSCSQVCTSTQMSAYHTYAAALVRPHHGEAEGVGPLEAIGWYSHGIRNHLSESWNSQPVTVDHLLIGGGVALAIASEGTAPALGMGMGADALCGAIQAGRAALTRAIAPVVTSIGRTVSLQVSRGIVALVTVIAPGVAEAQQPVPARSTTWGLIPVVDPTLNFSPENPDYCLVPPRH